MKHFYYSLAALIACVSILPLQAQVMSQKDRTNILEQARANLTHDTAAYQQKITEAKNPFFREVEEEEVFVETKPKEPAEVKPVVVISDEAILKSAASQLRPRGSMIKGDRSYILVPNGLLEQGTSFNVTYEGDRYTVTLTAVTDDFYRLKLGEEELTTWFNPEMKGKVRTGASGDARRGISDVPIIRPDEPAEEAATEE